MFGLPLFALLVLGPALTSASDAGSMVKARAGQRTEELVRACLVVSFASASLILLLQTALVSGLSGADLGENSLSSVLSSDFGLWSGARIPLVLGLAVLLVGRVRGVLTKETSTAWWGSWIVLSGGLLVATSLSGHASVAAPPWSVLNDVLHLASGSTWFAGVVGLGVVLPHAVASTGSISLAAAAVSRFATVALVSISLAATTGTINSFLALERFDDLWRDGYGRTLLAKIVVFMVVLGLGGLSHFVIRNRLERAAADAESGRDARRLFQVAIALEVLVGVAILVLTGLLTGLDPPGN